MLKKIDMSSCHVIMSCHHVVICHLLFIILAKPLVYSIMASLRNKFADNEYRLPEDFKGDTLQTISAVLKCLSLYRQNCLNQGKSHQDVLFLATRKVNTNGQTNFL
jgi:hypothetical protein